jgi:hypothetical protein
LNRNCPFNYSKSTQQKQDIFMKKSYLNSERNTALLVKPSMTIRLLLMVLFVVLFGNIVNAQTIVSFTTPGTTNWVCPAGVNAIKIETWGGGEGGSGNSGSGGGGAFAGNNNLTVTPGSTYIITVGVGGAAASGNGGD